MITSKFIFCGVQPGYHNVSEFTLSLAAKIVKDLLSLRELNTCVYRGVAVYPYDHGCPLGGEPVGALQLSGSISDVLGTAEYLRTVLRQVTLNVPIRDYGLPSVGFTVSVGGNMYEIGCAWQKIAKKYQISSGIHVSTGIVDLDNDNLILSADANPKNITNLSLWQNIAFDIFHDLGLPEPVFHSVGYNFVPALL